MLIASDFFILDCVSFIERYQELFTTDQNFKFAEAEREICRLKQITFVNKCFAEFENLITT